MKMLLVVSLIVGLGIALVLAGGILALLTRMGRALTRLVTVLVRTILLSVTVGGGSALLATATSDLDPVSTGTLAGLLFLPVALVLAGRARDQGDVGSRSTASASTKAEPPPAPHSADPVTDTPSRWSWLRRASKPAMTDEPLNGAWQSAAPMADWAPSRVAAAQTSCFRFLREADASAFDLEAGEWAAFIRRRVPELVQACAEQCREATGSEREALVEDLMETLETIGAEADRRRRKARRNSGTTFDVLRAHVANRVKKEGWL